MTPGGECRDSVQVGTIWCRRLPGFKFSRFIEPFAPGGLESKVTFAQDIPCEQVHSHKTLLMNKYMSTTNK